MSFGDDLDRFMAKLESRTREIHVRMTDEVLRSIKFGSEITGAEGQPVDTGTLRDSWRIRWPEDMVSEVFTTVEYAPPIEDGRQLAYTTARGTPVGERKIQFRSEKGGPHSVLQTRLFIQSIANHAARAVSGGEPTILGGEDPE